MCLYLSGIKPDQSPDVTFRWRVDRIQDLRGNRIEFSYYETPENSNSCGGYRERSSYLSEVRYNLLSDGRWGTRISFLRARRDTDGVGDYLYTTDCWFCRPWYQDDFLQKIRIENWSNGQYNILREYLLTYDSREVIGGHNNHTRRLRTIREYGVGGVNAGQGLPTTTFTYAPYWNKGWACNNCSQWDAEVFAYDRLTGIDNGYGGSISVAYESAAGEAFDWNNWHAWNYHVTNKTVSDGRSGGYKIVYTYPASVSDRCYDNNGDYVCDDPGYYPGGNLLGFRWTTEALQTTGSQTVALSTHEFWLTSGDRRMGREKATTRKDPGGVELQKVTTDWSLQTLPGGSYFIYPQSVKEYVRVGSGLPATPQKETTYEYSTALQGGAQYGNPTLVKEYQAGSLYRQTETTYYPNATLWIVDKPALVVLKDGAGNPLTKTRTTYDGNASYNQAPTRGDPAKVERTRAVSPADDWVTMQTVTYDPAVFYLPTQVTDANGHTTQTVYDSSWKLYPVTVTNAKGHSTTYGYDYARGLVTSVTGPNGSSTTVYYGYDAFGRLGLVAKPGDYSQCTIMYSYCDTCSPLRITTYERAVVNQPAAVPTVRYYNGLGQLIQEHHSTIDTQYTRITNYTYNAQGLKERAYLPYTISTPTSGQWELYVAPDTSQPKTVYAYDALGRVTTVTNPDNTTVRTFYAGLADGMETTVVDENGHQKVSKTDVFGRLVEVREYSGTYPGASLYATTHYQYSPLDLLTAVTDAAGNQTAIAYDALGRKTGMTDPDMGTWSYAYDNAGNLLRQTDARGKSTFFAYDEIDRLTGKQYADSMSYPNPFVPDVSYSYDDTSGGNLGRGYRTGMVDSSGSTTWRYDARGRVVQEIKTITGGGTFTTQWAYNSRDLVEAQTYPGGNAGQLGEVVTIDYWPWGVANSTTGASAYVVDTTLSGDGRVDLLKLGGTPASPTLQIDYVYFPWTTSNGRGRLQQIKAGTPANPTSLQDLRYTYDAVGNIASIQDWKAGSPETQSFSYDHLDRLTGVSGAYVEGYTYSTIGNLMSRGSAAYSYDAQKVHAVRSVAASGQPVTKTVTIWARGVTTDGVEPQMVLKVNGTACMTVTVQAGSVYRPYSAQVPLTGQDIFEVWYTNDNAARELWVDAVNVGGSAPVETAYHTHLPGARHSTTATPGPTPSPTPPSGGVTVQAEGGAMLYGKGGFQAPNVVPGQERLDEGGALRFVVGPGAYAAEYDANGNMTSRVVDGQAQVLEWDAENRLVRVRQGASVSTFLYDGDGNRVRATVDAVTTVYIGNYYEQSGSAIRTYYYHAGQRVAMREGGVTTWLFGDHLGSTSVAYRGSDGQTTRQLYYAWGTIRPGPGNALPTDHTFTGQKLDAPSGLMYYVARWYDPYVGRFIGADSLVQTQTRSPEICLYLAVSYTDRDVLAQWNQFNRWQPGADAQPHQLPYPLDPQFANRYTYARNSPLAYIDDSGHIAWWIVGGIAGAVVGFGAYALTHRDSFDWGQAALWTGGGAVVGATLGAGAQWVAGALAAETAATAGTAATVATTGAAAGSSASGRGLQVFSQAWKYGIDAYTRLAPRIAGTGLEVHHIIERRFALRLGLDERWIPSVALTPQEHQVFTQAWRGAIPYGIQEVTVEQVWYWAQRIYAGYPELLDAAFKTLFHQ